MREAILELAKEGRTILFSTHNMEQAERICHRILIVNHGKEVLSGAIGEIKDRFEKNTVAVEFDGNVEFLKDTAIVKNVIRYPRWVEIELIDNASSDELLKILSGKISVRRFEVMAPSLHKIFIQQTGEADE